MAAQPDDEQRVGQLLLEHQDAFKVYTVYCSSHPSAVAVLYRLDKSKAWHAFVRTVWVWVGVLCVYTVRLLVEYSIGCTLLVFIVINIAV